MKLLQIPFSHNCLKVRRALDLKGLSYDTLDIHPMHRQPVIDSSGQGLVPALEDGEARVADSTAILRHLESSHPEPSLLPEDPVRHAECWIVEDWADRAFMALARRLAYWEMIHAPDGVAPLFFSEMRGLRRRVMTAAAHRALKKRFHLSDRKNRDDEREAPRAARLALERIGGRPRLFGERTTVADIALATMAAPLIAAPQPVRGDPAVIDLLAWGDDVLGPELASIYKDGP